MQDAPANQLSARTRLRWLSRDLRVLPPFPPNCTSADWPRGPPIRRRGGSLVAPPTVALQSDQRADAPPVANAPMRRNILPGPLTTGGLKELPAPNLAARQHDIEADEPPPESEFDFVRTRTLLVRILYPISIIRKLVAILKPGGWIFRWSRRNLIRSSIIFTLRELRADVGSPD